jgi:hypothetical protein
METEYKKHRITYREDGNEWFCEAIGTKPSLKAMKAAIDNLNRKDRQLGVKALMLQRDYRTDGTELKEVKVTVLCEPVKGWKDKAASIKECWITDDGSRSKVYLNSLYPLSARAEVMAYIKEKNAHDQEGERLDGVKRAITTFDADTIMLAAKEEKVA